MRHLENMLIVDRGLNFHLTAVVGLSLGAL